MKTILGKQVNSISVHKYENVLPGSRKVYVNGMIWLSGDFNIIIRRGKFFLQHKGGKAHGVISKGTAVYRRIKRFISIYFRTYRNNLNVAYFQSVCDNILTQRIRTKLLQDLDSTKFYQLNTL